MADAKKCDCCGSYYDLYDANYPNSTNYINRILLGSTSTTDISYKFDLCPKCLYKIMHDTLHMPMKDAYKNCKRWNNQNNKQTYCKNPDVSKVKINFCEKCRKYKDNFFEEDTPEQSMCERYENGKPESVRCLCDPIS